MKKTTKQRDYEELFEQSSLFSVPCSILHLNSVKSHLDSYWETTQYSWASSDTTNIVGSERHCSQRGQPWEYEGRIRVWKSCNGGAGTHRPHPISDIEIAVVHDSPPGAAVKPSPTTIPRNRSTLPSCPCALCVPTFLPWECRFWIFVGNVYVTKVLRFRKK